MKYLLLLFSCTVFSQQLPLDSISYEYFYGNELRNIVQLKKELKGFPFNSFKQLQIAELYESINCEDSAYAAFYRLYEKEINERTLNDEAYKNLLFKLHETESSKHNYSKDRRYFLKLLENEIIDDAVDKWKSIIATEIAKDNLADSARYEIALKQFIDIQTTNFYKNNKAFKSSVLSNIGHAFTSVKRFSDSKSYLIESLKIANEIDDYYMQVCVNINLAVNEIEQEKYRSALVYLNRIDTIPFKKFKLKIYRLYYFHKSNIYYFLKDEKKEKISDAYFEKLDSVIDDFRKNSNFYEIDVAYQSKKKDAQIKKLSGIESQFKKHKVVYGLLIFGVFLLALYSFVRWKKVDKRKKLLALENQIIVKEKEDTITELENVKALVNQDHIVLKNKSKVYLDKLIYIKSDGHYLNLYTEDKKEFVRGKISEIQKQLPPNFVKCHRSYIVNKNRIKRFTSSEVVMENDIIIPLSRGFKF